MFVVASKIRASLWNSTSFLYFSLTIFPFLEREEDKRGERGGEGESKEDKKKRPEEKEREKEKKRKRAGERKPVFFHLCSHSDFWSHPPDFAPSPPLLS